MRRRRNASQRRQKPEWLRAAEWKQYVFGRVGPRVFRRAERLARPNLSLETLIDLDEQGREDTVLLLSTMDPERVDEWVATDPRWTKLAELRRENAALAAKLLAQRGIMVLQ